MHANPNIKPLLGLAEAHLQQLDEAGHSGGFPCPQLLQEVQVRHQLGGYLKDQGGQVLRQAHKELRPPQTCSAAAAGLLGCRAMQLSRAAEGSPVALVPDTRDHRHPVARLVSQLPTAEIQGTPPATQRRSRQQRCAMQPAAWEAACQKDRQANLGGGCQDSGIGDGDEGHIP